MIWMLFLRAESAGNPYHPYHLSIESNGTLFIENPS